MTGTDTTRTGQLQDRYARSMMPNYGVPPVALAIGKGCQVWDADGREYTDLIAGIAVSALGPAHPAITEAVTRQVHRLAPTSHLLLHEPQVLLAERLLSKKMAFVIDPVLRFANEPGEQSTMFFTDPSGNPIEIKGFKSLGSVYDA